uniref:Uncharacterized protein n=1 Tax=Arundo donax TaxID=35708 RepID=A0A0A8YZ06_ARUDO
MIIIYPYQFTC